ncbi:SYTL5 family protein [Megaselia abdita]
MPAFQTFCSFCEKVKEIQIASRSYSQTTDNTYIASNIINRPVINRHFRKSLTINSEDDYEHLQQIENKPRQKILRQSTLPSSKQLTSNTYNSNFHTQNIIQQQARFKMQRQSTFPSDERAQREYHQASPPKSPKEHFTQMLVIEPKKTKKLPTIPTSSEQQHTKLNTLEVPKELGTGRFLPLSPRQKNNFTFPKVQASSDNSGINQKNNKDYSKIRCHSSEEYPNSKGNIEHRRILPETPSLRSQRSLNRLTRQGNINHEDISQIQATSLTFSEAKINLEEYEAKKDVQSASDIRTEIVIDKNECTKKNVQSTNDIREKSILDINEKIKDGNIKDTKRSFSEETPTLISKTLTDDRRTISQPNTAVMSFDCEPIKTEFPTPDETCRYSNAVQTAASVFKKVVLKKRLENNEIVCGDDFIFNFDNNDFKLVFMNIASSSSEDSDADIALDWDYFDCFSLLVDSHQYSMRKVNSNNISEETNNKQHYMNQYDHDRCRLQTRKTENRNVFCYNCKTATADDQYTTVNKNTILSSMTTSKSQNECEYVLYKSYIPDPDNNIFDLQKNENSEENTTENLKKKEDEKTNGFQQNTTNTYKEDTPTTITNTSVSVHRSGNNNKTFRLPVSVVEKAEIEECVSDYVANVSEMTDENEHDVKNYNFATNNLNEFDDDGLPEDDSWKDDQSSTDNDDSLCHSINEESSKILYTIVEESCEESESYVPTQLSASDLEKYFFTLADNKHVTHSASGVVEVDDFDESSEVSSAGSDGLDSLGITNDSNELQSSRLEKYFLSGIAGVSKDESDSVGSDSESYTKPEHKRKKKLVRRSINDHSIENNDLDQSEHSMNSSDEETNFMLERMRQFFKTLIAANANQNMKEEEVITPVGYFENQLSRLMKTVPGINEEQVKEIVEYLSTDDYESSEIDEEGDMGDGGLVETSLVYQQLVASISKLSTNMGNQNIQTMNKTKTDLTRVLQHIGTKLVALMHEVGNNNSKNPENSSKHSTKPESSTESLLLAKSKSGEECDYERFSWRGSFESALLVDSRTRLNDSTSKRRSVGDLITKKEREEKLDRVRSCESIGGNENIFPMQNFGSASVPDAIFESQLSDEERNLINNIETRSRNILTSNCGTNSLPRHAINNIQSVNHVKSARYRPSGFMFRSSKKSSTLYSKHSSKKRVLRGKLPLLVFEIRYLAHYMLIHIQ